MLSRRSAQVLASSLHSSVQKSFPAPSPSAPTTNILAEVRTRSAARSNLWVHRFNDKLSQLTAQSQPSVDQTPSPSISAASSRLRMSDSFVQVFLPFRSDPSVAEQYQNPYATGAIRMGKILEELDALAFYVSHTYASNLERPVTIATASVDRIDLISSIPIDQDISIFGYVTYTGNSSMEVTIQMETLLPDKVHPADMDSAKYIRSKLPDEALSGSHLLTAKFIMVTRDPTTGKAAPLKQLVLETDEERKIFEEGAANKARKQSEAQSGLTKRAPSHDEMTLVHNMYMEYRKYVEERDTRLKVGFSGIVGGATALPKPADIEWMRDTRIQNIMLTFPQDRNLHGKVFGGWLMRLAFELGFASAFMFSRAPVKFLALDDISFRRPVEIGAILDFEAQVVYTEPTGEIVVKVVAHVVEAEKGTRDMSNEFWFTFKSYDQEGVVRKRIMPRSYHDCMLYLEGKRRFERE
ncbi:Acyl-coenzyme A thioesterase 9, mitochondrial [Chytriomyces hyalinus]|nr:Acyl-coenzyme A thioesterase 9, mitochondrial [Chytriomyces hyalinus]